MGRDNQPSASVSPYKSQVTCYVRLSCNRNHLYISYLNIFDCCLSIFYYNVAMILLCFEESLCEKILNEFA